MNRSLRWDQSLGLGSSGCLRSSPAHKMAVSSPFIKCGFLLLLIKWGFLLLFKKCFCSPAHKMGVSYPAHKMGFLLLLLKWEFLHLLIKKGFTYWDDGSEASLIVPDFTISVHSSSCNSFFFGLILSSFHSVSVSWHPILTINRKRKQRSENESRKRDN